MERIFMSDLAARLAELTGMSKRKAQLFMSGIVETIQEGINNDKMVKIKGLGTFKVIDVDARESVNVNTGERLTINSHQKLTFTPDSAMKDLVNKPFSQFETVVLNDGVEFDDNTESEEEEAADAVEEQSEEQSEEQAEEQVAEQVKDEVVEEPPVTNVEEAPVAKEAETPAPAVKEEAVVKEETVITEEPTASEESTVPEESVASKMSVVPEKTEVIEEPEAPEDSEESRSYWWVWLLLAVVACVGSFAGGYIFGRHMDRNALSEDNTQKTDSVVTAPAPVVAQNKDTLKVDSVKTVIEQVTGQPQQEVKEQPKQEVVEQLKKETVEQPKNETVAQPKKEAEPYWKKYEDMDSRVRTGAYDIVGFDHTVKVKSGETMKRLARRVLGEGMECYIEVFNNISSDQPLKEGQDIKIPKLELKKKRKK